MYHFDQKKLNNDLLAFEQEAKKLKKQTDEALTKLKRIIDNGELHLIGITAADFNSIYWNYRKAQDHAKCLKACLKITEEKQKNDK